jgi:hypothetical protein
MQSQADGGGMDVATELTESPRRRASSALSRPMDRASHPKRHAAVGQAAAASDDPSLRVSKVLGGATVMTQVVRQSVGGRGCRPENGGEGRREAGFL